MDTSIPTRNYMPAFLRQNGASGKSIAKSGGGYDDGFRISKGRAKRKVKETVEQGFQHKSREPILGVQERSHEEIQNTRNLRVQGLQPSASEAARKQLGDEGHSARFQQQMGKGGPRQMMQQRKQQRQPQALGGPGQIQQLIFQTLNKQTGPLSGWQARVHVQERIGLIFNL